MFGWRLIRAEELSLRDRLFTSQIQALKDALSKAEEYSRKCERLIDHERERIDSERERADRSVDALLAQNGLPAVTTTVRAEHSAEDKAAAAKQKSYSDMLGEIYGETLADMELEQPEPEELASK
jgi:IS4 transposase